VFTTLDYRTGLINDPDILARIDTELARRAPAGTTCPTRKLPNSSTGWSITATSTLRTALDALTSLIVRFVLTRSEGVGTGRFRCRVADEQHVVALDQDRAPLAASARLLAA
jgi:hypothetical protein